PMTAKRWMDMDSSRGKAGGYWAEREANHRAAASGFESTPPLAHCAPRTAFAMAAGQQLRHIGASFIRDLTMRRRSLLLAGSLLLTCGAAHAWLAEFGIEGMHVVSTPASEVRATISPDGKRIVSG